MSKAFMTKRKTVTAVIAVVMTVLIVFGGTFAWTSISQQALNEVAASANPGGRLHDDFVDVTDADTDEDGIPDHDTMTFNKDVYVENFTSISDNGVQVFARVRLDEYMEFGAGAGTLNDAGNAPADTNKATSLVPGSTLENKASWTTYIPGKASAFQKYWEWEFDGKTTYMPTFNKNKDSLEADINGTFKNNFIDFVDYSDPANSPKTDLAIYDADEDTDDELVGPSALTVTDAEAAGHISTGSEIHTAKETIDGLVITMEEWKTTYNSEPGDYWVYDTDGWAYWANPIDPSTSTGLLLDQISRTEEAINDDWYYGINVVAQFITKDHLGQHTGEGFYDDKDGSVPPSPDALTLLSKLGVEVDFEVDTADELQAALAHGGNITLTAPITVNTNLVVTADTVLDLGEHSITGSGILAGGTGATSLISVQGADTTLTIKGGTFEAATSDGYVIDVRDGAEVVVKGGTFVGNVSAVYVYEGSAVISGGTFSIQDTSTVVGEEYSQLLDAADDAGENATITVCGGTFNGFDPANANDGDLVGKGYIVTSETGTDGVDVYTVSAITVSTTATTTTTTDGATTTTTAADGATDGDDATDGDGATTTTTTPAA